MKLYNNSIVIYYSLCKVFLLCCSNKSIQRAANSRFVRWRGTLIVG